MNSNRKGKRGEREAAKALNETFGTACRRAQQYCGEAGDADLVGIPGIHLEVKRTETLSLYKAIEQAVGDAGDLVPMVLHKRNRKPWLCVVRLEDMPMVAEILNELEATR